MDRQPQKKWSGCGGCLLCQCPSLHRLISVWRNSCLLSPLPNEWPSEIRSYTAWNHMNPNAAFIPTWQDFDVANVLGKNVFLSVCSQTELIPYWLFLVFFFDNRHEFFKMLFLYLYMFRWSLPYSSESCVTVLLLACINGVKQTCQILACGKHLPVSILSSHDYLGYTSVIPTWNTRQTTPLR